MYSTERLFVMNLALRELIVSQLSVLVVLCEVIELSLCPFVTCKSQVW